MIQKRRTRLHSNVLVILVIYAAFWFLFGFIEIVSGDTIGIIQLVPAILAAAFIFLARKEPFVAGIALVVLGSLLSIFYFAAMYGEWTYRAQTVLITGIPPLITGIILAATTSFQIDEPPEEKPAESSA